MGEAAGRPVCFVSLFVCLVCLSCLSVCPSIGLSVGLSVLSLVCLFCQSVSVCLSVCLGGDVDVDLVVGSWVCSCGICVFTRPSRTTPHRQIDDIVLAVKRATYRKK